MMKDEGPYVIEWVAHHLAVGFSDLLVYTNDCSDGTDDMLIRLEELGLAHHRRNVIADGIRPQPSALNHAQDDPVVQNSDWVMVFNADEFLSIRHGDGTLDDLLTATKAEGANGIVVTWRIFGSGGVVDWSRAPVTEQYLMAAPPEWNKGWGVKTLFTFDADYWKLGIHRPKMKTRHIKTDFPDRVKWLTGSGRVMEDYFKFRGWRSITRTIGYDWVQLNHYAVKSVDSYAIRKLRGNVNNKKDKYNSDYWSLQDRNEVRDDTMLRYTARRDAIIAQLLSDPVLNRLHFAALDRAETRLAEIRQTDAYRDLVTSLAAASLVPISQIVAKPPQARDKEKIAALMTEVEKHRASKARDDRKAEGPKPASAAVPMGSYIPGTPDVSGGLPLTWVANHHILLPVDARIFPASALTLIAAGKFERSLARRLQSVLPKGASVLEIGAAAGFIGLHLAHIRPDLRLSLHEENPSLLTTMHRIMAKNERSFNNRLTLSESPLGPSPDDTFLRLAAATKPAVLLLADPQLTPIVLARLLPGLPTPQPDQIILYGRLLELHHQDLTPVEALLADFGYQQGLGFDPNIARGFVLTDDRPLSP
ncbi:MAG: glycosyltransferase family 2 protein [Candidatus Saccharibacteria bacterium]|nr:glycosyltransferase family 2 protein [Pseudorhodobacter sp.]